MSLPYYEYKSKQVPKFKIGDSVQNARLKGFVARQSIYIDSSSNEIYGNVAINSVEYFKGIQCYEKNVCASRVVIIEKTLKWEFDL